MRVCVCVCMWVCVCVGVCVYVGECVYVGACVYARVCVHALNHLWLTIFPDIAYIFPDIAYIFPDIAYFPDMAYVRHNGGVPTFARMRVFMCNEWKQNIKICGVLQVRHIKTHYDTRVPNTASHVRMCLVRVCFLLLHTLVSVVAYLCLCCGVLVFASWGTCVCFVAYLLLCLCYSSVAV